MTQTVHAVLHGRSLELIEPLDLPEGLRVAITVELPPAPRPPAQSAFPVRSLGPMKGSLGREEIYGDLV
ncbi:MAG: hypothetical protein ABSF35_01070 [Polyangia bacterium]|jgi:hypothetical protein